MDIESTIAPQQPYNPPKVLELERTLLAAAGFTSPPLTLNEPGPSDTVLTVAVDEGVYTAGQITQIVAVLDAVCVDPTRNDLTQEEAETAAVQAHLDALAGLSTVDKAYALMGRMWAVRDGAAPTVINAIVDRASAVSYVTGKSQWTNLTAASKAWEGQSLEMLALVFQVVLLGLNNASE